MGVMSLLDDDGGDCSVFWAQDEEIFDRVSRGQGEREIAVLLGLRVLDVGAAMDRAVAHALNPAARLRRVVAHHLSTSSSSILATLRSGVAKPSVNQP